MKSNKFLVIIPAVLMALTACGTNGESNTGNSNGTSVAPKEYISQAAVDSLKGSIKLVGTYTMENTSDENYNTNGAITTIFAGDSYYCYDESDDGIYELNARNVNGKAAVVGLNDQNEVVNTVLTDEYDEPMAWADSLANPLTGVVRTNIEKQADGTYKVMDAATRIDFALAAYGYYQENVQTVTLTVTNDKITKINFETAIYDYYGYLMQDSGEVVVSEHGTAIVPTVTAKPVVAAHDELTAALAAMGNNFTMSAIETQIPYEDDIEESVPYAYTETYTESAYYSSAEYQINDDDDNPVYASYGIIDVTTLGAYQFSKDAENNLTLVKNYPTASVSDLLDGYFAGFSVALLESKGDGVFTAYDDTAALVAPYLVLDSEAAGTVVELSLTVADGHIAQMTYIYDYELFPGFAVASYEVEITFSAYGTSVVGIDFTDLISQAQVYASISADFAKTWINDDHNLKISKIGVYFDNVLATDVAFDTNLTFTAGGVVYTATLGTDELIISATGIEDIHLVLTGDLPDDVLAAIKDTFGADIIMPGLGGATIDFELTEDSDGDLIIITASNCTITADEYLVMVEEKGLYTTMETGIPSACDSEEIIWIQIYDQSYNSSLAENTVEIYIWAY